MREGFHSSFSTDMQFGFHRLGKFNPASISSMQLYLNKNLGVTLGTGTNVASWRDQSANNYLLSQATASAQPIKQTNSINFDGVDDSLRLDVINPFIADTQGVIFFSINAVSGIDQRILVVNNTPTSSGNRQFSFSYTSNKIRLVVRDFSGSVNNVIETTNTFGTGYLYCSISSNESSYAFKVNGATQSILPSSGGNNGKWFSAIDSTNVISLSLLATGALLLYSELRLNKILYYNSALTAGQIAQIENFMSDPNN